MPKINAYMNFKVASSEQLNTTGILPTSRENSLIVSDLPEPESP